MKLRKILYIFLIILILPSFSLAEEYPYLPTHLKEKVISVFKINTSGKTQLYEKVNIYENLDAWMIGWFDDDVKIVTGITDLGDIIYYNISSFNPAPVHPDSAEISSKQGLSIATEFLSKVLPEIPLELVSKDAFEYTFSQTHNGIRIMGRDATVVVDKSSGNVTYYKGFGQTDSSFELLEKLVTSDAAFELFFEKIGLELVYNTVFYDDARIKTIRPLYILNQKNHKVIDAQSGEVLDLLMYDYNYYYNNGYYDEKYYSDNNIHTEEKLFSAEKQVYGYDISKLKNLPYLYLNNGYVTNVVSGKLHFYSDATGRENTNDVLQVNFVPAYYSRESDIFGEMFDNENFEWFDSLSVDTPYLYARAYIDENSGRLIDYETLKNPAYTSDIEPYYSEERVKNFVSLSSAGLDVRPFGTNKTGDNEYTFTFARYSEDTRIIGEGLCVTYDASLMAITDYCLIVTESDLPPVSFMKTPEEMKSVIKNNLNLKLFYSDKDKEVKHVVYDASRPYACFDPMTGEYIHISEEPGVHAILSCQVGSETYVANGIPYLAPAPIIHSGKLFLPIDSVASPLGYEVTYLNDKTIISNSSNRIELLTNSSDCQINGEEVLFDLPSVNISGKTYISIRSIGLVFGVYIKWDAFENAIYLVK